MYGPDLFIQAGKSGSYPNVNKQKRLWHRVKALEMTKALQDERNPGKHLLPREEVGASLIGFYQSFLEQMKAFAFRKLLLKMKTFANPPPDMQEKRHADLPPQVIFQLFRKY